MIKVRNNKVKSKRSSRFAACETLIKFINEGFSCQQLYPVPSPNIKGAGSHRGLEPNTVYNITPHLHRSCGILPCGEGGPHVHTAWDMKSKLDFSGKWEIHDHQTETDHEHGDDRFKETQW